MSTCDVTCPAPQLGIAAQTFAAALQYFAASQCLLQKDWPPDAYERVKGDKVFDFIIVGAGTAGCIVASQLSELSGCKILTIEAGGDPPVETIVPGFDDKLKMQATQYDWHYKSQAISQYPSFSVFKGKMLGGCSSMNGMKYVKGCHSDYEAWYNEGNKEWHPDIIKKYLKKAENLQDLELLMDPTVSNFFGHGGPINLNTMKNNELTYYSDAIEHAWKEIGLKTYPEVSAYNLTGAGAYVVNIAKGIRQDTATAYLNPIGNRTNLYVLKNTMVKKVLINPSNKEAYGVEVERNGESKIYYASKEVILSAGSISSPQLLMLSGVGEAKHLLSKNITPILDSPAVGKNLHDHVSFPVTIFADEPGFEDIAKTHFETIRYLYDRTGTLSTGTGGPGGIETRTLAFYPLKETDPFPAVEVDLDILYRNSSIIHKRSQSPSALRYMKSIAQRNQEQALFFFNVYLAKPYSRGYISLNTSNPYDAPLILENYLSDKRDIQIAAEGIKILTKIVNTKFFKSINGSLGRLYWEPCNHLVLDSLEYWKCVIVPFGYPACHHIGTCCMGSDPLISVVDSRLRVHNVKKLRVIDASIMPSVISSNPMAAVIAIAELASDMVKQEHGVKNVFV